MNRQILHISPKALISQQPREQMRGSLVKRLVEDMMKHGYDESQPVTGVRGEDGRIVISDGHHRVEAAIRAGIAKVPVDVHEHKGA